MSFHRLTVPSYTGGLPGGYDYINNAGGGTPANAEGIQVGGTNVGSYFFGFGDQFTSGNINRPAQALAENTDHIDDLLRRDIAIPTRTADALSVGDASLLITGPGIFLGGPGTPNTVAGLNLIYEVVDDNDIEIVDAGGIAVKVASIDDTVGTGFSAGDVTLTFTTPVPAGKTYRVYYGTRGNLATLPVDALTYIKIRGAEEVSAALESATGAALIGYAGGSAWADGTTNPQTTVELQLDKIVADLAGVAGVAKIGGDAIAGATYSLLAGTLFNQLGQLLADINTNAVNIATNTSDIATNTGAIAANTTAIGLIQTRNLVDFQDPGLRLTVVSSSPVTASDFTSGTLYYTPYRNGRIDLYDGSGWAIYNTSQISLILSISANTNYDVFAYWNGSTVALELLVWTTDFTRVALGQQDGIYVRASDHTRRYVGTIRGSALNTVADTAAKRFCWNFYNRVHRDLLVRETALSWNTTNSAWHVANSNAANAYEFVFGDPCFLTATVQAPYFGTALGLLANVGIGINSTTANSAQLYGSSVVATAGACQTSAQFRGTLIASYYKISWLEAGQTTVTFFGVDNANFFGAGQGEFEGGMDGYILG